MGRFDRFSDPARAALTRAQEEGQRFGQSYIAGEHVLLALLRPEDTGAARAFKHLAVNVPLLRERAEERLRTKAGTPGEAEEIGLTPESKQAIALAVQEARRFEHHYIGTEHLLLGLIAEGQGGAAVLLTEAGVTLDGARQAVTAVVEEAGGEDSAAWTPPREKAQDLIYNRMTERAKKVLELAQEEALRFNHNYMGTEHLLLGLVREGEGVAAKVLSNLGIDLIKVRNSVEFIIGRGERQVVGEIGLTPRAKKVIELAGDEARRLGHHYIGTEHLLLGLIREGEGIAAGVLESLGVNLERVRSEAIKVLSAPGIPPRSAADRPPAGSGMPVRSLITWEYRLLQTAYRETEIYVHSVDGREDTESSLQHLPLHAALHHLGREGWELAAVDPTSTIGSGLGATYIFKRPRP